MQRKEGSRTLEEDDDEEPAAAAIDPLQEQLLAVGEEIISFLHLLI